MSYYNPPIWDFFSKGKQLYSHSECNYNVSRKTTCKSHWTFLNWSALLFSMKTEIKSLLNFISLARIRDNSKSLKKLKQTLLNYAAARDHSDQLFPLIALDALSRGALFDAWRDTRKEMSFSRCSFVFGRSLRSNEECASLTPSRTHLVALYWSSLLFLLKDGGASLFNLLISEICLEELASLDLLTSEIEEETKSLIWESNSLLSWATISLTFDSSLMWNVKSRTKRKAT